MLVRITSNNETRRNEGNPTYQLLHHGLALGPEFPDRGEDITPVLSLDLLDQDRESHVDTAPIRAVPRNSDRNSEHFCPVQLFK